MIGRNGFSLGELPSSFAARGMEPYSPVMVTTAVLDTPSEVWLGKASSHKEPSATCSTVRTPRKTSRNWAPLGGLVVLSALACCVVSCLTARLDAASTRAAPFVSVDCQHSQLSVPLFVQLHLGAQVHARLRNLRCQQEQEVEPQPTESTNAPPADCRETLVPVQRFHLGAQVPPYPRNPVTSRPTLHRKSLHPSLVSLHPLIGYPIACHRFLACCVSASALLLGTATCDNITRGRTWERGSSGRSLRPTPRCVPHVCYGLGSSCRCRMLVPSTYVTERCVHGMFAFCRLAFCMVPWCMDSCLKKS